jgi:hypothetical protein
MAKLLLTATFSLITFYTFGQPLTRVFTFPENNGSLVVYDIEGTADGSWYAAGNGVGDYQMFITKFDDNQQVLWSNMYKDRRDLNFMQPLSNGNLLVFNNNGAFFSYFDASILALDVNGQIVNETIWGSEGGIERWSDIAQLSNGQYVVLGYGNDENTGSDFNFMLVLNPDGTLADEKHFEFENGFAIGRIIPTSDGGFYALGGGFFGEFFITRFDADFNLTSNRLYVWGTNEISLFGGTLMPDGSLFAYGSGNFTNTNFNFFGCKFDEEGNVLSNFYLNTQAGVNPDEVIAIGGDTVLIATTSNNQFWPIVDNDNLTVTVNSATGDVYSSYAFGSDSRDYPFAVEVIGDNLVWGGLTSQYTNADTSYGYIAFSPIGGSGACPKDYEVSKGELVNLQPEISGTNMVERPFVPSQTNETSQVPTTFALVGSCSAINSSSNPTDVCTIALGNFDQTLQSVIALAEGEIRLTLSDLAGRQLINSYIGRQVSSSQLAGQLNNGLYIYTLNYTACGASRQVTGKLPVTR